MGMQVLPGQVALGVLTASKGTTAAAKSSSQKSREHWCAPQRGQGSGTDGHGRECARLQALPAHGDQRGLGIR